MSDDVLRKQALCLQCMECCKQVLIPTAYSEDMKIAEDLYKTRGFTVIKFQGVLAIRMFNPCPHLGEKGCDIYSKRPQGCRIYDGRKDSILGAKCRWNELKTRSIFDHVKTENG